MGSKPSTKAPPLPAPLPTPSASATAEGASRRLEDLLRLRNSSAGTQITQPALSGSYLGAPRLGS